MIPLSNIFWFVQSKANFAQSSFKITCIEKHDKIFEFADVGIFCQMQDKSY